MSRRYRAAMSTIEVPPESPLERIHDHAAKLKKRRLDSVDLNDTFENRIHVLEQEVSALLRQLAVFELRFVHLEKEIEGCKKVEVATTTGHGAWGDGSLIG